MLTAQELKQWLHYDPETGHFTWLKGKHTGKVAGHHERRTKYVRIGLDRLYMAHRLAFLYMTDRWPNQVDHIDLCRSNNAWANLREATNAENHWNTLCHKDNSSGLKGVGKSRGKFYSTITYNGKKRYLGTFKTPEEAHSAYCAAAEECHQRFARTG